MIEKFVSWLHPKLSSSPRWYSFKFIGTNLLELNRPVNIVETGCVRRSGAWLEEGQSTLIWDWIVSEVGGSATSFDISESSVNECKKYVKKVDVICSDSISGLRAMSGVEKLDLVYLDSYDATDDYRSPLHHIGELACVFEKLRSGCMIAVDDCLIENPKSRYIEMFFASIGLSPAFSGYIKVWIKP